MDPDQPISRGEDFIGRGRDLAVLASALEDAQGSRPRVMLVHGAPGMGKSALLRRFLRDTEAVRVPHASGDETETALSYGVVSQLLGGLRSLLPDPLPVLGATTGPSLDPLTVGAALVELLGVLQDDGLVVVVVDDAVDVAANLAVVGPPRVRRLDDPAQAEPHRLLPPRLLGAAPLDVGIL